MKYRLLLISTFVFHLSFYGQHSDYKQRFDFKALLEPADKVISGAGQTYMSNFNDYVSSTDSTTRPVINMIYITPGADNISKTMLFFMDTMQKYKWYIIPQIGLNMAYEGNPELNFADKVARGDFDKNIDTLCEMLNIWNTPVFIRIGYEFNGIWNGYKPESYKKAFRRVADAFDKHGLKNIATVWCYCPLADTAYYDFMQYYPGDQYVDWWAVDLFETNSFNYSSLKYFMDSAMLRKKPVMIGESTPAKIGVLKGEESWDKWFKPYFEFINNNANIKAFCYINRNWSARKNLAAWGETRLSQNEYVRKRFIDELKSNLYLHGDSETSTKKNLRITK